MKILQSTDLSCSEQGGLWNRIGVFYQTEGRFQRKDIGQMKVRQYLAIHNR